MSTTTTKKKEVKDDPIIARVKCPYCSAITTFKNDSKSRDIECGECKGVFQAFPIPEFHRQFNRK